MLSASHKSYAFDASPSARYCIQLAGRLELQLPSSEWLNTDCLLPDILLLLLLLPGRTLPN
jgi:hypothetical protein